MSKHDKQVRRERVKAERRRRSAAATHGAAALAAAAAIAAGTNAYASPVRFENTAGFQWNTSAGHENLNILADSASQPGVQGANGTFTRIADAENSRLHGYNNFNNLLVQKINAYDFLEPLAADELVTMTPGTSSQAGIIRTTDYYATYYAGGESLFPEGEDFYLGVRFDPGDGFHYGWIGVTRNGWELDPFAWGYETEPGVAIPAGAVPEPGTLALLALGAAAVAGRRRSA